MNNNKPIVNFYFNSYLVPIFLFFPILMISPLYRLSITVTTFSGFAFLVVMTSFLLFLTIRIVKYLIRLILKKPALTLTEEGLFDFQTGLNFYWNDIKGFKMGTFRITSISIELCDNEKYFSKFRNPLKRIFYRFSSRLFNETFSFNVSMLEGNNEKILECLELYLKTNRKAIISN